MTAWAAGRHTGDAHLSRDHAVHPEETEEKKKSQNVATVTHHSARGLAVALKKQTNKKSTRISLGAAARQGEHSNLFGAVGRGLDKGSGEVHDTYFPLEPEAVAP